MHYLLSADNGFATFLTFNHDDPNSVNGYVCSKMKKFENCLATSEIHHCPGSNSGTTEQHCYGIYSINNLFIKQSQRTWLLLGRYKNFSLLQRFCRFAKKLWRAHSWFRSWNYCDGFYFNVRCCWRRLLLCEKIKTKKSEKQLFFSFFQQFWPWEFNCSQNTGSLRARNWQNNGFFRFIQILETN